MHNHTHFSAQHLGTLGWNWSFLGDIQTVSDTEGNVTILNSGIQSLLPQQLSGTALYEDSQPYNVSTQQLLVQGSDFQRTFERQADGSYKGQENDKGILTKEGNIYRLKEKNGTTIVFRTDGQLDYVQDANGYKITAGYTNNRLTNLSATDGDSFTLGYNAQGRINSIADQTGQTTTYTYDSTGQYLISISNSDGTTSFTYGHPYDPTAMTGITYADGSKITYDYDEYGRLQQVIYGQGRQALSYFYTYDANGGYTFTDLSGAKTTVTYNEINNSRTLTDPLGHVFQYNYDAAGLLDSVTGANGFKVDYDFCDCGQLRSSLDPLGNKTTFNYEPNFGKLQSVTDARGNDLIYGYDTKGNLASITYEDGSQQQYSYNAKGQLTGSTNRRGQDITYEYNAQYQLVGETHENGSSLSYTYDSGTGSIKSITDSQGTTQVNYDRTNNKLSLIYASGRSLTYTFDILGRRTQLVTQDGSNLKTVKYTYDAFGRLARLTDGANQLIVDYTYDSAGRLQKETNGNGTYTTYTYDAAGQVTSLVNYAANGSLNSRFNYTYDALGRRSGMTTLDGTWTYTYDLASQLTRAIFTSTNPNIASQDLTYVYDAAGNRIQTIENGVTSNYQTNNLNQYTTAGAGTYSYDADGNLISKTEAGKSWTYGYDDQNRLIGVIDSNNNKTQYEYDIFGNRSATIYNGQRTEYLVDPLGMGDVLAEYDGNGNQTAQYTHGLGLVSRTNGGSTAFYDFDAIGSTVGLTGATGTTLNRYSYRPFGEDFYEVETIANSFEYVGQFGVMEEVNGLDFMRARYYDSGLGRFAAIDPIGLQGGDTNFYKYVANNPVSYVDPQGESIWIPLGLTYLGVGASCTLVNLYGSDGSAAGLWLGLGGAALSTFYGNIPGVIFFGSMAAAATSGQCNPPPADATEPPDYPKDAEDGFDHAQQVIPPSCPLILDLDGDGLELTPLNSPLVRFDLDGDGFREATGWVKPDDGLLAYDRNGDKFINDISELFGNQTTGGFAVLRQLDSNTDGSITAADTAFSRLQVWRDLDSDGRSDVNELFSLAELGITRIGAVGSSTNLTNAGNSINETATFTLANGTQRQIANVWFALDQLNSYYDFRSTYNQPVAFTQEILNLPNLHGYGNLPDLQVAMAKDPQLLTLVKTLSARINQGNLSNPGELIRSLLFRWAGVDNIASNSRGSVVNAQELGFLEKFMGRAYSQSGSVNPLGDAGTILSQTYAQLVPVLFALFVAQVADLPVQYDPLSDLLVLESDTTHSLVQLEQAIAQSSVQSELTEIVIRQYFQEEEEIDVNWLLGTFAADRLFGTQGSDRLYGFMGDDTLLADYGNDTLNGGDGQDNLNGNYGDDLLDGGAGNDALDGGVGSDTLNGGDGSDTLDGRDSNDNLDGSIGNDTLDGGDGSDTLDGGDGSDNLDGSLGSDNLLGGASNDTLHGSVGSDTLDGGEGDDYLRSMYGDDLTWTFKGQSVSYSWSGGENTPNLLLGGAGNDTLLGSLGADTLLGGTGHDSLHGHLGNDSLTGGEGQDSLDGSIGDDTLDGGADNDTLDGSLGSDSLLGGVGNDFLNGSLGSDTLDGGDGDDILWAIVTDPGYGEYDNHLLIGGAGNDTLNGSFGNRYPNRRSR